MYSSHYRGIKFFNCTKVPVKYKCSYCNFTTSLWTILKHHIWRSHKNFHDYSKVDSKIETYTCKNCNFRSYSILVWHLHERNCRKENLQMKSFYIDSENFFCCKLCKYKSIDGHKFQFHFLIRHTDDEDQCKYEKTYNNSQMKSFYIDSENLFCCKLCKYKSIDGHKVQFHFLIRHTDDEDQCKYEKTYNSAFRRHKLSDKELKLFKCDLCEYETTRYSDFMKHRTSHPRDKKLKFFKCGQCEYETTRRSSLIRHKLKHGSKRPKRPKSHCSQCPFTTVNKARLKFHTTLCHMGPEYVKWYDCNQCEYKGRMQCDLTAHIKRKHPSENQKYFQCDQCSYKDIKRSVLNYHVIARHGDPKKIKWFKCNQCEYKSKLKSRLNRHIKGVHDGLGYNEIKLSANVKRHLTRSKEPKSYACTQCEFKTPMKKYLTRHIDRKHINPERFKCSHCSYKTAYKGSLRVHVIARHTNSEDINWFECYQCEHKTKRKQNLKRHIEGMHGRGYKTTTKRRKGKLMKS